MNPTVYSRVIAGALAVVASGAISGCYYMQAVSGQLEVMRKREPIAELIDASDTPAELARRLKLVEDARDYSVSALGLPDNDSYRSYTDLERDFVVWNVFAAPEFSLEAKTWCFPVAGCVGYRGYFSKDDADREAADLSEQGFDVAVGGISAYSTLGRFSDPVLSTMMHWEDVDLIATMFHELAHQVLYVKGDTGFNESFATVVEEVGIERWLSSRDEEGELDAYRERRRLRQDVMEIVNAARVDLDIIYSLRVAPNDMRRRKAERLALLIAEIHAEFDAAGRPVPRWVDSNLNNARIASMSMYEGRVGEFRELLRQCEGELHCFYSAARELSES